MPEQRFSIGESGALLDIDRVTLQRWMKLAGIEPLSDPADKRYRYLSRSQILTLAKAHGRNIRDETSIGPRLTGLQRELLGRIQRLEEDHAEGRAERAEIMRRLDALLSNISEWDQRTTERYRGLRELARTDKIGFQTHQEGQQAALPPAEGADYPDTAESPENAPSEPRGAYVAVPQVRTRRPPPKGALRPGEWQTLPPIPDGWVTPRLFARELGIPERTFNHALAPQESGDRERSGTIPYHEGRWRAPHPGTYAADLLDPEQQAIAREQFTGQRGE